MKYRIREVVTADGAKHYWVCQYTQDIEGDWWWDDSYKWCSSLKEARDYIAANTVVSTRYLP